MADRPPPQLQPIAPTAKPKPKPKPKASPKVSSNAPAATSPGNPPVGRSLLGPVGLGAVKPGATKPESNIPSQSSDSGATPNVSGVGRKIGTYSLSSSIMTNPERLRSIIKASPDLTISGVPKKVFAPTLPASRKKKEEGASANAEQVPQLLSTQSVDHLMSADRATVGKFGRTFKPKSKMNANSAITTALGASPELSDPGLPLFQFSAKKKKPKVDITKLEVNPFDVSHPTSLPLTNPLADKDEEEEEEEKVDEMDLDIGLGDQLERSSANKSKTKAGKKGRTPPTAASELLLDNEGHLLEEEMFFVQLPSLLPLPAKSAEKSSKSLLETLMSPESENRLEKYEPGFIGKLQIHKSGKISMLIGDTKFQVLPGTQTKFLQELAILDMQSKSYHLLGSLSKRLIVTPDF